MNIIFKKIILWLTFVVSLFFALYILFSRWAVNAENFGKYDMGSALFFSFSSAYAMYISLGTTAISLVLVFIYKLLKTEQYKVFVLSFLIGLIPIMYYLWLDNIVA
jgi:hypothetical protein